MQDLISRQAAIEAFEDTTYTKNEIRRRITELPSVQPEKRWIPVSERLPEEDGTYIVSGVWGSGKKQVGECNFQVDDGYFDTSWNFDVEAWMPMLEPYKGE